jgi:hypothetical protein
VTVKEVHSILFYVDKDNPNGPFPTRPEADPMFLRWEKPVQEWAKKNGYVSTVPADEKCRTRISDTQPVINISQPTNHQTISASSVTVNVSISGFGAGTAVSYSLDGQSVGTVTESPYSTTIDLSKTDNGFHTITAAASDDGGHSASASVVINSLAQGGTTLYFLQPAPSSKISSGDFPVAVKVFAHDSKGFFNLSLWSDNPNGSKTILDQVSNPSSDTVVFSWPTTAPGSYRLYVVAVTSGGKTVESDRLPVTVQ